MCYFNARIRAVMEEQYYRVYVTDGLRALCGSDGERYIDAFLPQDTRTQQEVVSGVFDSLRKIREGGE